MRRPLPADDQVNAVMTPVLAQAAETGRKPTVTAVERDLGIPHATFDRNYRDLIDGRHRMNMQREQPSRAACLSTWEGSESVRPGRCCRPQQDPSATRFAGLGPRRPVPPARQRSDRPEGLGG
jgi:hypothetical protein